MKLISKLIIPLFLFLSHSSISQSLNSRTPLNPDRYQKIQAHHSQQKRGMIKSSQKDKKELKKVKSEGITLIQQTQNTSVLDDVLFQYWIVQSEIIKAKKENDLGKILDLEKRSLRCRRDYVLAFEINNQKEPSREQQKIYKAFKKDFAHE